MSRFFKHLRIAFWRAFEHDAFAVAKGAAFSAILTFFPAILVLASILSRLAQQRSLRARDLPRRGPHSSRRHQHRSHAVPHRRQAGADASSWSPTILITLWTASGVMISWMEGFRKAYQMPKIWGLVKERLIAFLLVVLAGFRMGFASFLRGLRQPDRALDHVSRRPRTDALHPRAVDGACAGSSPR